MRVKRSPEKPSCTTDYPDTSREARPGTIADQLDEDLTREMLDLLMLELPDHKRDLCAAWETGDYEAMGRLVHKLHGGALYCNVPGLVNHLQVMKASLAGRKAETIRQSLQDILSAIDDMLNRN